MAPQIQESADGLGRYMDVPLGNWPFFFFFLSLLFLFPTCYLMWEGQRSAGRKDTAYCCPRPPPTSLRTSPYIYLRPFDYIWSALPIPLSCADPRRTVSRCGTTTTGGRNLPQVVYQRTGAQARFLSSPPSTSEISHDLWALSVTDWGSEEEREKESVTWGRWAQHPTPLFRCRSWWGGRAASMDVSAVKLMECLNHFISCHLSI